MNLVCSRTLQGVRIAKLGLVEFVEQGDLFGRELGAEFDEDAVEPVQLGAPRLSPRDHTTLSVKVSLVAQRFSRLAFLEEWVPELPGLVEERDADDVGTLKVEFTGPDPGVHHYDGDDITVSIIVEDTHNSFDDVELSWRSDLEGDVAVSMSHRGGGVYEGDAFLGVGDHLLTVFASDGDGNADEDSTRIEIGPENSPPTCAIVFPTESSVGTPGEMTILTAEVSDPDVPANMLRAEWASTIQGPLGNSAAGRLCICISNPPQRCLHRLGWNCSHGF